MTHNIFTGDVMKWAAIYTGEKFHALATDAPYHLTTITDRFGSDNAAPAKGGVCARSSRGFMGQTWDGGDGNPYNRGVQPRRNNHPTVKPISLTRWLATLLLPPAEYGPRRLLVPFSGVGSEMIGAVAAGWEFVQGIEMTPEYVDIAEQRLNYWSLNEFPDAPKIQDDPDNLPGDKVNPDGTVQFSLFDSDGD